MKTKSFCRDIFSVLHLCYSCVALAVFFRCFFDGVRAEQDDCIDPSYFFPSNFFHREMKSNGLKISDSATIIFGSNFGYLLNYIYSIQQWLRFKGLNRCSCLEGNLARAKKETGSGIRSLRGFSEGKTYLALAFLQYSYIACCSAWPKLKTKIGLHPPHHTNFLICSPPPKKKRGGGAKINLVRNNRNQSCYKLPEMARNLVKNDFWDTPRKKKPAKCW